MQTKPRILMTGANGNIGKILRYRWGDQYLLKLADIAPIQYPGQHEVIQFDITNYRDFLAACQDIDTLIHLAANPHQDATFKDELLPKNIIGAYHAFQAAAEAGCQRIIFASSITAVLGYKNQKQVDTDTNVFPINLYGATKCFGEALARVYSTQHNLSCICIRSTCIRSGAMGITHRDLAQLFKRCVALKDTKFAIVHGTSNKNDQILGLSNTCELLGYEPEDDFVSTNDVSHFFCWPNNQHEMLLKAALLSGDEAKSEWQQWHKFVDIDDLDNGSHRLLPLLYHNLVKLNIQPESLDRLKGVYRYFLAKNQLLFFNVSQLLKRLVDAGITITLFKGIVLAKSYYDQIALRPMDDIDLYVSHEQMKQALQIIIDAGWRSTDGLTIDEILDHFQNNWYIHAYSFTHPSKATIDLHWNFLTVCPNADADLLMNAQKDIFNDIPIQVLGPTDMLFHTCVHGANLNRVPPIRWLADAYFIISHSNNIDWQRLIKLAETHQAVGPVRDTLNYLAEKLHVHIPQAIMNKLQYNKVAMLERIHYELRTKGSVNLSLYESLCFFWDSHKKFLPNARFLYQLMMFPKYLCNVWQISSIWKLPFTITFRAARRCFRALRLGRVTTSS